MTKLIALLLIAVAFTDTPSPTHRTYLPIITSNPQSKAGVAFASHIDAGQRIEMLDGNVSYWRGWQNSSDVEKWGLEGVNTLWCDFYFHTGTTNKLVDLLGQLDKLGSDYDGYLLFLNEPDLTYYGATHTQCEVTPYRAAQIYQHVKTTLPNAKLIGPGIHHLDYKNDFKWLAAFYSNVEHVTGAPPDMYAWDTHNYMQDGDPLAPYDALETFLNERGVNAPIFWVSEWSSSSPERVAEMKSAFDSDPRIQRHYFFDGYRATWEPDWVQQMTLYEEQAGGIVLSPVGRAWLGTE